MKAQIIHYIVFKYGVLRDWPCICEGLCLVYARGLVMNVWCLAVVFPTPMPRVSHSPVFFTLSQHSLLVLPRLDQQQPYRWAAMPGVSLHNLSNTTHCSNLHTFGSLHFVILELLIFLLTFRNGIFLSDSVLILIHHKILY